MSDIMCCNGDKCKIRDTCKRFIVYKNEHNDKKYMWIIYPDLVMRKKCNLFINIKDNK